jgi:hypothetical protein
MRRGLTVETQPVARAPPLMADRIVAVVAAGSANAG